MKTHHPSWPCGPQVAEGKSASPDTPCPDSSWQELVDMGQWAARQALCAVGLGAL